MNGYYGESVRIFQSLQGYILMMTSLDGTMNFTFSLNRLVHFYSGIDLNVEFDEVDKYNSNTQRPETVTETIVPLWLLAGAEIGFRKNVTLLFEVEISLNDDAYNILSGGINFYL